MNTRYRWLLLATFHVVAAVASAQNASPLVDVKATKQTQALFKNLKRLSQTNILFGHQHATEYGHGWTGEEGRSDVKSVTGSHPAVVGFDFNSLFGSSEASTERNTVALRKLISDTYNRGGVPTIAWHFSNRFL